MNIFTRTSMIIGTCVIFACTGVVSTSREETEAETQQDNKALELSFEQAEHIFSLPIHCLEIEYPNKLGQVLGSDQDLKSPKSLRPIFYGCFDWHSSVHGYWSVVELMKEFPNLDQNDAVRNVLNNHITPENVALELAFFEDPNNLSFERTYGWAWLFKLQESLYGWEGDSDALRWKTNLQPLVDLLVDRYQEYLPKLAYPIRAGQHDNSAFSLSLALDYARTVKNKDFEKAIQTHAVRLFENDRGCDLNFEPSGYDFLSPCLEEAYLMKKVLSDSSYKAWLTEFLPALFDRDFKLDPAIVTDRTDGKLVHLDGLNYSRAVCLHGIAENDSDFAHLKDIGNEHVLYSLPNLSTQDDYMGSHWLGTFALYALKTIKKAQ